MEQFLIRHPEVALLLVIAAGCWIGSFKIGTFSLGPVEGRRHLARSLNRETIWLFGVGVALMSGLAATDARALLTPFRMKIRRSGIVPRTPSFGSISKSGNTISTARSFTGVAFTAASYALRKRVAISIAAHCLDYARFAHLERFRAKWIPVRVKKTRQTKK